MNAFVDEYILMQLMDKWKNDFISNVTIETTNDWFNLVICQMREKKSNRTEISIE